MCEVVDMLIWLWESFQYICTSNHRVVHFKYITILFVHYTSLKLGRGGGGETN